jgi:hypothetical protein
MIDSEVARRRPLGFGQKIKAFFEVLFTSVLRGLSGSSSYEKIALTDRLYMRVPKAELTLMSVGGGEVQSTKLSVDEAAQIFRSIKRAFDLQETVEVRIGDLTWKTVVSSAKVTIVVNGPQGYTREVAKREDVEAAVANFDNRFGP